MILIANNKIKLLKYCKEIDSNNLEFSSRFSSFSFMPTQNPIVL